METVVYFIRHSEKMKNNAYEEYNVNESWKKRDEKKPLTVAGEKLAEEFLNNPEFDNVELIYSSPYTRTIGTAKYLAERLELKINVDKRLEERVHGETSDIKPELFYYNQHHDFDYKLSKGESLNDTKKRITDFFKDVTFTHYGKNIAFFTHEHTMISFLLEYCKTAYTMNDELVLTYGEENFTTTFNQPDCFKVILEDNEVINIEKI